MAQNWGSKLLGQWQGEKYRGCKFVSSAIHTKFKEHNNMWPFFPLPALAVARTNLQVRVQCFILALKKGSNNLASGSIFCSPLHFLLCRNDYIDDDVVVDSCRPVQRQEILSKNISSGTNLLAFWVEWVRVRLVPWYLIHTTTVATLEKKNTSDLFEIQSVRKIKPGFFVTNFAPFHIKVNRKSLSSYHSSGIRNDRKFHELDWHLEMYTSWYVLLQSKV